MNFEIGETHQIQRGPGKPYKAHVLAIVDCDQVVIKWYGRHKQRWHYEVVRAGLLAIEIEYAKETSNA